MNTPKRIQVFERDNYTCWMCGKTVIREGNRSKNLATIDHYVPKSKGGSNSLKNLRTACYECNTNRSNQIPKDLTEFGDYNEDLSNISLPKQLIESWKKDDLICKTCSKEVSLKSKKLRNGKEPAIIIKSHHAVNNTRQYYVLCRNCNALKKLKNQLNQEIS